MQTLPYISLPAPLVKKAEKQFLQKNANIGGKLPLPHHHPPKKKMKASKRKLKDQLVIITFKKASDAKE
jgi:hypothetical protein